MYAVCSKVVLPWAVNYSAVQPGGGTLTAVVGDSHEARLLDWSTGKPVATLEGHYDYSFAVAWHPDGRLVATGNQVCRCAGFGAGRLQGLGISTLLSRTRF